MQNTNLILGVIFFLILVVGFFYTMQVGKRMEKENSQYDEEVSEKVERHPYVRNPVFIVYIVALSLVLLYIFYVSYTANW